MDSYTPILVFGVEIDPSEIKNANHKNGQLKFDVDGINLGIIKRPIQAIEIDKRVSKLKISKSSEEEIINAQKRPTDPSISTAIKDAPYTTYIGNDDQTQRRNTEIKSELDDELLQNVRLEVTYNFTVTNNSEKDYSTVEFYRYGTTASQLFDENVIKISPTNIVDYLDKQTNYAITSEANENNGWTIVTDLNSLKDIVMDDVLKSKNIKQTSVYKTEKLGNEKIAPGDNTTLQMEVERRMTSAKDQSDTNVVNQVEIVQVEKTDESNNEMQVKGMPLINPEDGKYITCGNYVPSVQRTTTSSGETTDLEAKNADEPDSSMAESVLVVASTGGNRNYIPYIGVAITALVAIAGGVYFIRKKLTK